ncbi:MAG: dihydrofolate reductase family protein [candidate division WOR-3 bacterium]|nr:MAG: dihydrofolate reductase family protein [candidate division WOR-3 bacterium]
MILPKVVIHNSMSLDGSLTGFEVNMALHYALAARYKPGAHLIGSNTLMGGIESSGKEVPPEEKDDFSKPEKDPSLPYWVIPDTSGKLYGMLHTFRRFDYCRDVILVVSDNTPREYLRYLEERSYDYHSVGKEHADLKKSLALLEEKYKVQSVLVDAGRILSSLLLGQGLVDEISLLVHPVIVGKKSHSMFSDIVEKMTLTLDRSERLDEHYTWLVYRIEE